MPTGAASAAPGAAARRAGGRAQLEEQRGVKFAARQLRRLSPAGGKGREVGGRRAPLASPEGLPCLRRAALAVPPGPAGFEAVLARRRARSRRWAVAPVTPHAAVTPSHLRGCGEAS